MTTSSIRMTTTERPKRIHQATSVGIAIFISSLAVVAYLQNAPLEVFGVIIGAGGLILVIVHLIQSWSIAPPTKLVPIGLPGSFARRLSGNSIIIGRMSSSDISLPLQTISGHHCRIFRCGKNRWCIEDLSSSNGTFVNDRRIRKCKLRVGDKITIGEFEFRVG